MQKNIKLLRKWLGDISRIYIHKFMKLFMNFLWTYSKTTWKNWACQYFQNYHEFFMTCFQNYLEKLGLSIFPKLPWIVSKTTWKFRPPQNVQVVLEMFPSSFGNVSCIFWDSVGWSTKFRLREMSQQIQLRLNPFQNVRRCCE
jgi:hypothetical protein